MVCLDPINGISDRPAGQPPRDVFVGSLFSFRLPRRAEKGGPCLPAVCPTTQWDKISVRLPGSVDATCVFIYGCVEGRPAFLFACPTGVKCRQGPTRETQSRSISSLPSSTRTMDFDQHQAARWAPAAIFFGDRFANRKERVHVAPPLHAQPGLPRFLDRKAVASFQLTLTTGCSSACSNPRRQELLSIKVSFFLSGFQPHVPGGSRPSASVLYPCPRQTAGTGPAYMVGARRATQGAAATIVTADGHAHDPVSNRQAG